MASYVTAPVIGGQANWGRAQLVVETPEVLEFRLALLRRQRDWARRRLAVPVQGREAA